MFVPVSCDSKFSLFAKGAPESVIDRCDTALVNGKTAALSHSLRETLLAQTAEYGKDGLRTLRLALAFKDETDTDVTRYKSQSTSDYSCFEQGLMFVSLVGMLDPL